MAGTIGTYDPPLSDEEKFVLDVLQEVGLEEDSHGTGDQIRRAFKLGYTVEQAAHYVRRWLLPGVIE